MLDAKRDWGAMPPVAVVGVGDKPTNSRCCGLLFDACKQGSKKTIPSKKIAGNTKKSKTRVI
jgi:hypothetical protein